MLVQNKFLRLSFSIMGAVLLFGVSFSLFGKLIGITGAPPYGEAEPDASALGNALWLDNWQRPKSPPKVGLQVGHWQSSQLPEELARLRNNTGSNGGGKNEWEVNLKIARETAKLLKTKGVEVKILPATVPPNFWADVFVAIHADGSLDRSKSGFKIAAPWRDMTGKASNLVGLLESGYQEATDLAKDPNVTRNMKGYYAFSWWRYQHSIHPMTPAVIVETGFLTNWSDRQLLTNNPEIPAAAIAESILTFLSQEGVLAG